MSSRVISVEIYGQRYPIRSELDPAYVLTLASYVDEKMQAAADELPTGDSLKLAVIAAINIADEFFRSREGGELRDGEILKRAEDIERLVDRALAEAG